MLRPRQGSAAAEAVVDMHRAIMMFIDWCAWRFCRHGGPQQGRWLAEYGVAVYRCRNCGRVRMTVVEPPGSHGKITGVVT